MAAFPLTRSQLGLLRVAAAAPALRVADVAFNVAQLIQSAAQAADEGVQLLLTPELSVTGYSCGDLFFQHTLLEATRAALPPLADVTATHGLAMAVGLPLAVDGRLFNVAAFLAEGRILGIVPKSWLPNYREFYEARWFSSGAEIVDQRVRIGAEAVPFGVDLLFDAANVAGATIGIEICEDLWAVEPPSGNLALHGATVLLNPSASNEVLGKVGYRRALVKQQSARCLAAYCYAGAGPNESTTDTVWSGHCLIAEDGTLLVESERFQFETQWVVADLDLQRLSHERLENSTFGDQRPRGPVRRIPFNLAHADAPAPTILRNRPLSQSPFVPQDTARRADHCEEIFAIQSTALAKRLAHVGVKHVTIGVSGGLDSTLALLVTVRAFDRLGLDRAGIVAITMPGFGTTARTRGNAERLAEQLGVTLRIVPIHDAVVQHFADIGHDPQQHDVTYENAQARERTQILMDVANQVGGFVVGTGDLSELALGWMTFNADHMSMYNVDAGVPKTLVRYLVQWVAETQYEGETAATLHDIVATPITPELLPLDKEGQLAQKTEESIGPYDLNDFFLFYVVRYGMPPRKVFYLAGLAFEGRYDESTILHWLRRFYQRFIGSQYKRSAMPDGPKVGSVSLSPRADWRMPSDAQAALWLAELERMREGLC
ncbi:MAG: NAD(+) synthase [Anaerolineales bacterium]|nr:NAD(+) synthase [Anaerolineales bacterium]MCB9127427.1 NAD(+) synthase [Ardenticatenales bacterium]MCB9172240.1 NAD(+) synthase [Ardenticatenales bacterium]